VPFSTGVLERAARGLSPGFTDHHTRAQQPGSSRGLELSFRAPEGVLPVCSDHSRRNRPVPPASSTSKPCSPCESVPTAAGISPWPLAVTLLVFRPFRARPPAPRVLRPAQALRPEHRAIHPQLGGAMTCGTSRPLRPGEASPHAEAHDSTRSAASDLLRDRPAPPLGGAPTPMTLEREAEASYPW